MTYFPGITHDADGNVLDVPRPRLERADLATFPHRFMVTNQDGAPVAHMWLLDDATPAAVSVIVMQEAVQLVLAGRGVLILARRPEPEVDVRDALLQALDAATGGPG